jgi:hypothetical protein
VLLGDLARGPAVPRVVAIDLVERRRGLLDGLEGQQAVPVGTNLPKPVSWVMTGFPAASNRRSGR